MDIETDEDALRASLYPITKHFGASQNEITELIVKLSLTQQDLLVFGKVDGQVPEDIVKRNGIAYIEGWDSFAEIGTSFERFYFYFPILFFFIFIILSLFSNL